MRACTKCCKKAQPQVPKGMGYMVLSSFDDTQVVDFQEETMV